MNSLSQLRFKHHLPMFCILLLVGFTLSATAAADLPSTVASRVKKVEAALTAADQAIEKGQMQTAERKLKEAERPLKEIADRYSGKFDENDPVYKAMVEHLAATTAKVKGEAAKEAGALAANAEARAKHEAHCQEWVDKLGPFVDHKSDLYLPIGSRLNSASPEVQARAQASFQKAKVLFAEYQKVKFAGEKTRDLLNVESSLTSTLGYYGEDEADAAQEAACKEWEDRLAPYFDSGMISDKRLIASATVDSQQIARQKELFEEVKALSAMYQKAEFPQGKTHRLQGLEEEMMEALEEFPKAMAQSQAMMSGDVGKRLDQVLRHMSQDTAWKEDSKKKPRVIMERDLEPLRKAVTEYSGTVQPGDGTLVELQQKLKTIEEQNAESRAICAERTFQRADGYTGSDIKDLKEKAKAVAAEAHPKAKIHLITVPSKEWAVEDVVEFTDTSNTAVRRRITRSVRAEISLKDGDGKAWLQEVYLGQDKLPDGGWSAVKAHTTWADPMAVENLGKTAAG